MADAKADIALSYEQIDSRDRVIAAAAVEPMQRHRDAWRRYAYGKGEKPSDFLDGNLADRGPTTQEHLKALCLDMGRLIRSLDESGEHSEWWTQDGDYIIDGRFPK